MQLDVAPDSTIDLLRIPNKAVVEELDTAAMKAKYSDRWTAVAERYAEIG